jgi:3-oxoacyl-[acyl-carrier protein] reductase
MNTASQKVALVTGSSRGIGKAIALELATDGHLVIVNYLNSEASAHAVVAEIKNKGGDAVAIRADVSKADDIANLFSEVRRRWGRLDVLVNNAGVFDARPLKDFGLAEIRASLETNFIGPVLTTQAALELMGTGGKIINISSDAVNVHVPNTAIYAATKAALDQVTRVLAREVGARGITVNSVLPGYTATDWVNYVPEEVKQDMASKTALGRLGTPEDIAATVSFLASEKARWITGQTISVTGGL